MQTDSNIYAVPGKNYAPKKPWDEVASKLDPNPTSLCKAIQKRYDLYFKKDDNEWQEHCDSGRMVANLREGKMLLMRNLNTNALMFTKRTGVWGDNKTQSGIFQFYTTKLDAEWISSKPEIDPICPSNADNVEQFISNVKIIQDAYNLKFFTDLYEIDESRSAQDFGTYVTRYRFDVDKKDIVCELLPFPACRWDIRYRAEESSYFIYESKCPTAQLEYLLNCSIPSDGDDSEHYGVQLIEQIAKQGSNTFGNGKDRPYGSTSTDENETIVTEMWLQPEAYCDIELDENEQTIGGDTIKKGRTLLDLFPKGMCIVGINGMKSIIGVYAEDHKDHIVTGLYHVQSFRGVGKGLSDAVDCKKDIDHFRSQMQAMISAHATPATYFDQNVITEAQVRNIGKPRKAIPIDMAQARDGVRSVNDVISTLQPVDPARSLFEIGSMLNNDLQMSMQVTDFTGGLPGVDNKTATGAKIGDANAEMILVPQHRLKADHRCRSFKVIYNLFKKYMDAPKWFANNAKNSISAGKEISGKEFDGIDIEFRVVANSEVPQTPFQEQQSLAQVLQFTGGVAGLLQAAQMNPEVTSEIVSAFGAKTLSIPKMSDIARVCRRRIDECKKLLETEMFTAQAMGAMGIQVDISEIAEKVVGNMRPPISPYEPYAQQKASWMADLLDSDELEYAPQELRYVVEELIERQLQTSTYGQAMIAQDQDIGQIMADLPSILGEQMMNKDNQEAEQQFQQQQAQQQMQQEQANQQQQMQAQTQQAQAQAQAQDAQAHAQHQRALAVNDQQHAQASAQAQQQHQQALQLEGVRQLAQLQAAKAQNKKAA